MKKCLLALIALLPSFFSSAANFSLDARTLGYASAGSASAHFLSAGFYNPALAAIGHEGRTLGVIFPMLGIRVRDENDLVDDLEHFSANFSRFLAQPSDPVTQQELQAELREFQQGSAVIAGGIAGSAAIATDSLSGVFFISTYNEGIAFAEITQSDINNVSLGASFSPSSQVRVVGYGIVDIGLALAKQIALKDSSVSWGITPKIQQIYTYHHLVSILNFDSSDWTDISNRTDKSALNFDIGAVWQQGTWRFAFVGKNVVAKTLQTRTKGNSYTYELSTLFTLGTRFDSENFMLSADLDLNAQERFKNNATYGIEDDTQWLRLGAQYQINDIIQLRAGYSHDFKHSFDDTLSLGFGLGIDTLSRVDIALELMDKNSYGAFIQLSFSL